MVKEKLCIYCTNFCFEPGEPDWSEFTPGYNARLECNKNHYDITLNDLADTEAFRKHLQQAETCPDYKQVEIE